MQNHRYLPMILIVAATILSACSSMPQNPALTEAHNRYHNARTNPEVIDMAEPELIAADESIDDADHAVSEQQSNDVVNHLAYIAKQKVAIAEETAKWKTTELAVIDAAIKNYLARRLIKLSSAACLRKRNLCPLGIKMNKTEAAKQRTGISQQTVDSKRHAAELAVAGITPKHSPTQNTQQELQLKALNAEKTDRGLLITIGDVSFRSSLAQLDSNGMHTVQNWLIF